MTKKYECDICGKIVNPKDIFGLEICEINEDDGNFGSGIFDIEICNKCKKEIIKRYGTKKEKKTTA